MRINLRVLGILLSLLAVQDIFALEKDKPSVDSNKPPTKIKELLLAISKKANKGFPVKSDEMTITHTRVEELSFIYSYTMNVDENNFEKNIFPLKGRAVTIQCNNSFGPLIKKSGVDVTYEFLNQKGEKIGAFYINALDCNLPVVPVSYKVNKGCVTGVLSVLSKSKNHRSLSDEKKKVYTDKCSARVSSAISQQGRSEMNQMSADPSTYGCNFGVGLMLSEILSKDELSKVLNDSKLLTELVKIYCS